MRETRYALAIFGVVITTTAVLVYALDLGLSFLLIAGAVSAVALSWLDITGWLRAQSDSRRREWTFWYGLLLPTVAVMPFLVASGWSYLEH